MNKNLEFDVIIITRYYKSINNNNSLFIRFLSSINKY